MSVESPKYEVLSRDGAFELRRYAGYLTANVRMSAADPVQATNAGFELLADYIFGNNRASDRIAMTAPVTAGQLCCQRIPMTTPVTAARAEHDYVVSFTMPSSYSMKDLPLPNNPAVQLETVGQHIAAVVRFSGHVHGEDAERAEAELRAWMEGEGLTPTGEPTLAQYDAPWKPGFARHNEVLLRVTDDRVPRA